MVKTSRVRKLFFRAWMTIQVERPILLAVFGTWAKCLWRAKWTVVFGFSCANNLSKLIVLRDQLRTAEKASSKAVRNDRHDHHKQLIDSIADSFVSGDFKSMYCSIKHVLAMSKTRNATDKLFRVSDEQ